MNGMSANYYDFVRPVAAPKAAAQYDVYLDWGATIACDTAFPSHKEPAVVHSNENPEADRHAD
jgi:hypothetical protein